TGRMHWEVFNGSSSQGKFVLTSEVFPQNQWVHVAVVDDGQGTGFIYWNGVLKASGPMLPVSNVARALQYFGRSNWSSDAYFNGSLDEIRIWNVARTQAQIQANLSSVLDPSANPGLVGSWRFEEGAGLKAADATANQYDGDLGGAAGRQPTWAGTDGAPLVNAGAAATVSAAVDAFTVTFSEDLL